MKYKLYTKSNAAWDAMLSAISGAKESIYIEMYIFLDDTSESHDFIGRLIEKSKSGVKIVMVIDSFGSSEMKKASINKIKESGIEILFFSNWLRRIHRKILIIDEKIAFIGGVNIGKKFVHWNDMQIKIDGLLVKRMMRSFAYSYELAGGEKIDILKLRKKIIAKKVRSWMLEHWSIKGTYALKDSYIEKFTSAKKNIKIITPYFAPPRWLIAIMEIAIKRGIKIEIIVPQTTDHYLANRINLRYMYKLKDLGIDFYTYPEMNHAKIFIIDDSDGLIGSQNLDILSFSINIEGGIFFRNKNVVKDLNRVFEKWKKESSLFSPNGYKRNFLDIIIRITFRIFKPIL